MKKQTKEIVRQILIEHESTRKDDFLLIYEVINKITGGYGKYIVLNDLAYFHASYGIPSFESITRARRQVQKEMPELKEKNMAEIRAKEEKEFREEYRR